MLLQKGGRSLLLKLRFAISSLVWVALKDQAGSDLGPSLGADSPNADLEPLYTRLLAMLHVTDPLGGVGLPDTDPVKAALQAGGVWCRSWVLEAVLKQILLYAASESSQT